MQILAQAHAEMRRKSFQATEVQIFIAEAKFMLLEKSDGPVDIKMLAKNLNVGYSWFRRMFKEYTGMSPSQYHLQLRMNKARELLKNTYLPIAKIAHSLGFESEYYFSRIFKTKNGKTPRDFRAQHQRGHKT